jgi:hypothetical protein
MEAGLSAVWATDGRSTAEGLDADRSLLARVQTVLKLEELYQILHSVFTFKTLNPSFLLDFCNFSRSKP